MADTNFIKKEIEPYVLQKLVKLYGQQFKPLFLPVGVESDGKPRKHEFDAVSDDSRIVAGIKSSTGKTSGGKRPTAKIATAYKEMYFLSLVKADHKLLVITDPEFLEILIKEFRGILPPSTAIIHIPLPTELQEKMDALKGVNY